MRRHRITLRLPAGLEYDLRRDAERQHRSLNQHLIELLDWALIHRCEACGLPRRDLPICGCASQRQWHGAYDPLRRRGRSPCLSTART